MENDAAYGYKDNARKAVGRKIDVLMEYNAFELSASEWKTESCGQALREKQHNKNARVNACILSRILRLPFNENEPVDCKILTMEWTGTLSGIISVLM